MPFDKFEGETDEEKRKKAWLAILGPGASHVRGIMKKAPQNEPESRSRRKSPTPNDRDRREILQPTEVRDRETWAMKVGFCSERTQNHKMKVARLSVPVKLFELLFLAWSAYGEFFGRVAFNTLLYGA